SRRRHTRSKRDWSSDVCSSDLASLAERCHAAALGWVSRVPHGPVVSDDNRNGSVNLPRAATLVFCDEVTHSRPFGNSVSHMSRCQLVPVVCEPLLGDRRVRPIGCGCHSSRVRSIPFHDHAPVTFRPFFQLGAPAPRVGSKLSHLPAVESSVHHPLYLSPGHTPPWIVRRGLPHADDKH